MIDKFIEYETARPTFLAYEFQTLRSVQKEFFTALSQSMSKFKVTQPHEGEPTEPIVAPLKGGVVSESRSQMTSSGAQPRRGPRGRRDDDEDEDEDEPMPRGRQSMSGSFRRPTPGASQSTSFNKGPKKSPFGNAASDAPVPVDDEVPRLPPRRAAKGVYALVMYDFPGEEDDELPLREGQKVRVTRQHESGWWTGEINGNVGVFPATYVKLLD